MSHLSDPTDKATCLTELLQLPISPMICKACGAEMPDDHRYCGGCGSKLSPDPLDEVMLRLNSLGTLVDKQMQLRDQRFLDIDTTEKIVTRLMNWARLFAFFIGIPLAAILVSLALYAGKGFKELHDMAATARDSLRPLLEKVRSDAETAKRTASDALRSSSEVSREVASTKRSVSELQSGIGDRMRAMERTNEQIKQSQSEVAALGTKVKQGSTEIARMNRQLQDVSNEKNATSIRDVYPILGERVAGWRDGNIDPAQKKANDVYVSIVVAIGSGVPSRLSEEKVGRIMTLLKDESYSVFLGGVSLYATSARTSQSIFSIRDCSLAGVSDPPCIIYFRPELKETAAKIRTLITQEQLVSDDRFRYVDPGKLTSLAQELLQKSGLDILVVLESR